MFWDSASGAPYRYWAEIDTQLRRAAFLKAANAGPALQVRLLISDWAHSQPFMPPFLKSLASIYDPKHKLDIQVVSGCPRTSANQHESWVDAEDHLDIGNYI